MLTLVAAVLAYDRVDRASETCERKSGRSELRLAMSETRDENDMAARDWIVPCASYILCLIEKPEGRNGGRCGENFRLKWWLQKCSEIDRAAKVAGLTVLISNRGLQCCTPRIARSQASGRIERGV